MKNEQIFKIVKEQVRINIERELYEVLEEGSYEEFEEDYFENCKPDEMHDKMQEFKKSSLEEKIEVMADYFRNQMDLSGDGVWDFIKIFSDEEIELD